MTGNEVCSRLNERTDPPRAKPFDFAELVARVRALSRRAPKPPPVVLQWGGIVLDRARHGATR
ncbi:hypothetical protein [Streptomyces canus]|uniref:hypothetical protein n=1 Tax=Streptomyces canus TaxID=58343 RepID=UPI00325633D5